MSSGTFKLYLFDSYFICFASISNHKISLFVDKIHLNVYFILAVHNPFVVSVQISTRSHEHNENKINDYRYLAYVSRIIG